jgi:hypothetical protein
MLQEKKIKIMLYKKNNKNVIRKKNKKIKIYDKKKKEANHLLIIDRTIKQFEVFMINKSIL